MLFGIFVPQVLAVLAVLHYLQAAGVCVCVCVCVRARVHVFPRSHVCGLSQLL